MLIRHSLSELEVAQSYQAILHTSFLIASSTASDQNLTGKAWRKVTPKLHFRLIILNLLSGLYLFDPIDLNSVTLVRCGAIRLTTTQPRRHGTCTSDDHYQEVQLL